MRKMLARLATLAVLLLHPALSAAQWDDIDLELVLLADATGSIDEQEIRFQRRGYAEAIVDPAVLKAITDGAHGRIAVAYVEWANALAQDVVVDWTVIDSLDAAENFATRLMAAPRRAFGRNAIGAALLKGVEMIETNAHEGFRKVIDFSGDSANNWNGPSIAEGRAAADAAGITINGLAILCRSCPTGRPGRVDLERLFAERIVTGPGHFVITADSDASFMAAVRRKLILEISGETPPRSYAAR